jgi:hypothetical protein
MDVVTELLLICLMAALGAAIALARDNALFTAIFSAFCGFALTLAIQRERRK